MSGHDPYANDAIEEKLLMQQTMQGMNGTWPSYQYPSYQQGYTWNNQNPFDQFTNTPITPPTTTTSPAPVPVPAFSQLYGGISKETIDTIYGPPAQIGPKSTIEEITNFNLAKLDRAQRRIIQTQSINYSLNGQNENAHQLLGEAYKDEENQRQNKIQELERAWKHTDAINSIESNFYVPNNIFNVEKKTFLVSKKLNVMGEPESKLNGIIVRPNKQIFLSHENYCQGVNLKYLDPPEGDISNIYVLMVTIENIRSTLPYPVGVRIVSKATNESPSVPYNSKNIYVADSTTQGFDCIIPAFCNEPLKEFILYKSNKNINHDFGVKYPNITSDPATFYLPESEPIGNNPITAYRIHILAAIVRHIFLRAAEWGYKLPEVESNTVMGANLTTKIEIPYDICKKAEEELLKITKESLPVKNASELCIELIPITFLDSVAVEMKRYKIELLKLYSRDNSPSNDKSSIINVVIGADENSLTTYGSITFNCNVKYAFRQKKVDFFKKKEPKQITQTQQINQQLNPQLNTQLTQQDGYFKYMN